MKNHLLQNIENYNKELIDSEKDVYTKYIELIRNFLTYCFDTIKIKINDNEYFKFIIIKGIHMISLLFKMLLLYTRNLFLTFYHCQKAYSYYIEFIGQIGTDANTYLNLNSKDAILFVYKKTIFDINMDVKKVHYNEDLKYNTIDSFIDCYNSMIINIVSTCEKPIAQLDVINGRFMKVMGSEEDIKKIKVIIDAFTHISSNYSNDFTECYEMIIKKIKKDKTFQVNTILNKIYSHEFKNMLQSQSHSTCMNKLMSWVLKTC